MSARRPVAALVAAVVLCLHSSVVAVAIDATPLQNDLWPKDKVLNGAWSAQDPPPVWMRPGLLDAVAGSNDSKASRAPTFKVPSNGEGTLYYRTPAQSTCPSGTLACAGGYPSSDFWRLTMHKQGTSYVDWCDSPLTSGTCWHVRRVAVHELGHALGLEHNPIQDEEATMMYHTVPWRGTTGASTTRHRSCDQAGLQLGYDVASSDSGYAACHHGLATAVTFTAPDTVVCPTGRLAGELHVQSKPAYAQLSGNPLGSRTVRIARRNATGTFVNVSTATTNGSGRWSMSLGLNHIGATLWRSGFEGAQGLAADTSAGANVNVTYCDPMIRPWGAVTGTPPLYKSPDIYVVDANGSVVNAAQGIVNRLRARIHNLGTAAASGVKVRFRYAPAFAGLHDSQFKDLGSVTVDVPAGTDVVVPIDWDLTDPHEDNGGVWPHSISMFTHFCVQVLIEDPNDPKPGNNAAQSNFDDVKAGPTAMSFAFLVGNPGEQPAEGVLHLSELPEGFAAEIIETDLVPGVPFAMEPGELRVAWLRFTAPEEGALVPDSDVISDLTLTIDGEVAGGMSYRLARVTPEQLREYQADCERVFQAAQEAAIREDGSLAVVDPSAHRLETDRVEVSFERLLTSVTPRTARLLAESGVPGDVPAAAYSVTMEVVCSERPLAAVEMTTRIIVNDGLGTVLDGEEVASGGRIETAHFDGIAQLLGT
jgi:hypothetical protein